MSVDDSMGAAERANLPLIEIDPAFLAYNPASGPHGRKSNPFSGGTKISKYREKELLKVTERKSFRTDFFEKKLITIAQRLGGRVSHASRLSDGEIRSPDSGCLGFSINNSDPKIRVNSDKQGFITEVEPLKNIITRYKELLPRLLKESGAAPTIDQGSLKPLAPTLCLDFSFDERRQRESLAVIREGAAAFRRDVLSAWGSRCLFSGCEVEAVLDAAHIFPYAGKMTNRTANGLALRADVHRLFDQHILSIEWTSDGFLGHVSKYMLKSEYGSFAGLIQVPGAFEYRPALDAVAHHLAKFYEREGG